LIESSIPRNIRINAALNENIPFIEADRGQVQQVVMNLILNAAEAFGDKTGTITLSTGAMWYGEENLKACVFDEKPAPGNFVWFEITDTGCGMDEKTKEKIFEPFFTTKFIGRGLGLAAIHGILRNHGGNVFVKSEVGTGTTFRVLLPAVIKSNDDVDKHSMAADKSVLSGTVLVADDEKIIRSLCSEYLKNMGFEVILARGGNEALQLFSAHTDRISLVLLDYMMPDLDGVATFEGLKNIKPDCTVILSSGYSEEEATRRFEGKGLSGFIQKPYKIEKLQEVIKKVLKR